MITHLKRDSVTAGDIWGVDSEVAPGRLLVNSPYDVLPPPLLYIFSWQSNDGHELPGISDGNINYNHIIAQIISQLVDCKEY